MQAYLLGKQSIYAGFLIFAAFTDTTYCYGGRVRQYIISCNMVMEAFIQIYKCLPFQTEFVALIVVVTDKRKGATLLKEIKYYGRFMLLNLFCGVQQYTP